VQARNRAREQATETNHSVGVLACPSHTRPAAERDRPASTSLRSGDVLIVLSSAPAGVASRTPRTRRPLPLLATILCEKGRLRIWRRLSWNVGLTTGLAEQRLHSLWRILHAAFGADVARQGTKADCPRNPPPRGSGQNRLKWRRCSPALTGLGLGSRHRTPDSAAHVSCP
jgi:hypothetical protein